MANQHMTKQQKQMLRQQQVWQWRAAMQAEYERLNAMPLADLATEVMARAFGPQDPGSGHDPTTVAHGSTKTSLSANSISQLFIAEFVFGWNERGPEDTVLRDRIVDLVAEGLQVLEHALLVRCQIYSEVGRFYWAATRYGRAVLDQGQLHAVLHGRQSS
jgi:hypothetical protein